MQCKLPSSWKVIAFTILLLLGLGISQLCGAVMAKDAYKTWMSIVIGATMWCLSFIMINVGYEFTIDKKALGEYGWDYLIAMTAAGFPWIFVAIWFKWCLGVDIKLSEALLVARFAAPTSAGILFSMLDAAGLKDTWLFQKARILAIFDDLDTILLMIPLKVVLVGFKWELAVVVVLMAIMLACSWFKLHALRLPHTWPWTLFYAAIIAAVCKVLYILTKYHIDMEEIHLEVLLPAFVLGTMIDTPCARHELELQRRMSSIRRSQTAMRNSLKMVANANAAILSMQDGQTKEAADSDATEESIVKIIEPKSASGGVEEVLPGTVGDENGVEPSKVAPTDSKDAALRVVGLAPESPPPSAETIEPARGQVVVKANSNEGPREAANKGAWVSPNELAPDPPGQVRSVSKQSAQSNVSKTSSGRGGHTRYGHKREDVRKASKQQRTASKDPRSGSKDERSYSKTSKEKSNASSTIKELEAPAKSLEPEPEPDHGDEEGHGELEEYVQTGISMIFMVLVGLSMPALVGKNAKDNSGGLSSGMIVLHVFLVSILMIIGKMFPVVCYRDEAPTKHRVALCLGMCPRGEVGASIIVISLEMGVEGPAVIIAMCCLGTNLIMSGGFIASVKYLLRGAPSLGMEGGEQVVQT